MKAIRFGLLGVAGLLALAGFVAYSYLKPMPPASAPIQAVALQEAAPAAVGSAAQAFQIVPGESQARFVIEEVLQGAPKTVVGTTDQVAGQIALDPSDLDSAQVGTILIDARTFATDSSQRDRAIQNMVLKTAQNEYISFTPTELVGLPDGASLGEAVPVQVIGDLTIGGVTRPATFDASLTPESAGRLEGNASTTIRYADWGITIPQVPVVTGVSDTVRIELDFAAQAA
jgi:polyisoprenoid-binding protein YceI